MDAATILEFVRAGFFGGTLLLVAWMLRMHSTRSAQDQENLKVMFELISRTATANTRLADAINALLHREEKDEVVEP